MITFSSIERMNELVAKANKPLAKLGIPAIQVLSTTPRKVSAGENCFGETIWQVVYDADLLMPETLCKVEGQDIVARLESIEGLNMITRIGGFDGSLDQYRNSPIACQHCNLKRKRNGSWVIVKEDGQKIQVGDTCVDLYFGVNVESILKLSHRVHGILNSDCDEDGRCSGGVREDVSMFILAVSYLTATKGFVTKKAAGEGMSTAATAEWLSNPCDGSDYLAKEHFSTWAAIMAWRSSNTNLGNTAAVLDWWMERETPTEFEHNCRVAILSQSLKWKGIVAYAVKMWHDSLAKAAPVADTKANEWIATVGEKVQIEVTVTNLRGIEGAYGTTTMLTMEDKKGNSVLWYASNNPGLQLGQTYTIKGSVKANNEFKGRKQTVLTRCKVG